MEKEEIFEVLEGAGCKPKYIDEKGGFSRWIEFETKYQKCWIEWYTNVSTLRVGDRYGIRIPFHKVAPHNTSPANKKSLLFTNDHVTKNFGLADSDVELTLEKLEWQE